MSDIGAIGDFANDPFAASLQRQQVDPALEQQQQAQEQARQRAQEALGLLESGSRSLRERERNEILERAGPGLRQEEVNREGDSPRLRQLSDETAEIDTARIQRERRGPTPEDEPRSGTGEEQIRLSEEAQRRLAQETPAPPPPGEAIVPEPDDPLTVDTQRERQEADLSDQIDRGRNETQAGRQIGQVLDQFS